MIKDDKEWDLYRSGFRDGEEWERMNNEHIEKTHQPTLYELAYMFEDLGKKTSLQEFGAKIYQYKHIVRNALMHLADLETDLKQKVWWNEEYKL